MSIFHRRRTDKNGKLKTDSVWSIEFRDHENILRRVRGFTDKAASRELERQLGRLVAQRMAAAAPDAESSRFLESCHVAVRDRLAQWNIIDMQRASGGRRLDGLIDAWGQHLSAIECSKSHVKQTVSRAKKVFAGCRIVFWTDIQAEKVETWLADRRRHHGMSARTSNSHLASAKAFCGWMKKTGHVPDNPLSRLSIVNEKADKRRKRQALDENEINRLLAAAADGPVVNGMTGPDRVILYRLALESGLRWGELYSLTRASFDFVADPATVTIGAGDAKNGLEDTLPLRPELAAMLEARMALSMPTAKAFPTMWKGRGAKMLRADLEAAGIPVVNEWGEVVDFHSLRHSFISGLARAGIHPKIAQDLARHSTVELTMRNYTHTKIESRMEALEKLPNYSPVEQPMTAAKTGTDDLPEAAENVDKKMDSCGRDCMDETATHCDNFEANKKDEKSIDCVGGEKLNPADSTSCGASKSWHPHGESNPGRQLEKLVS